MALFPAFDTQLPEFNPEGALRFPVGAASPLWFAFASAASVGVAYWWMTRWTRPANLEAFDWFAPKAADAPAPESAVPAIVEQPTLQTPVAAALEPVEAATDAVVETVAALAEPVKDAVEETAEANLETTAAAADDLTRLVGVGPRLAERLAELGVKRFKDIAAWSDEDLANIDRTLDLKGRAVRDAWVAQARRLAEG